MSYLGQVVFFSPESGETVWLTPRGQVLYRLEGYHGTPGHEANKHFSEYGSLKDIQARHVIPTCCGRTWTTLEILREKITQRRLEMLAKGRTPVTHSKDDVWKARWTCVNADRMTCGHLHIKEHRAPCLFVHRVLLFEPWVSQEVIGSAFTIQVQQKIVGNALRDKLDREVMEAANNPAWK